MVMMMICWVGGSSAIWVQGIPRKDKKPTAFQKRSDKISKPTAHYRHLHRYATSTQCLLDRKQLESLTHVACAD